MPARKPFSSSISKRQPAACTSSPTHNAALRAVDWDDHRIAHAGAAAPLLRRRYADCARPRAVRKPRGRWRLTLPAISRRSPICPPQTNGTAFQLSVWAALRQIPVGRTVSYGALAARDRTAEGGARGRIANGANPIAIVVPCHRVIGADASLTGYGGGLHRKRWLLAHECGERPLFDEAAQGRHA